MTAIEKDTNRAIALPPSVEIPQVVLNPRTRSLLYLTNVVGRLTQADLWRLAVGFESANKAGRLDDLATICFSVGLTNPNKFRFFDDPFLTHVIPFYTHKEIADKRLLIYVSTINNGLGKGLVALPVREKALVRLIDKDLNTASKYGLVSGNRNSGYKVCPECNETKTIIGKEFIRNRFRLDKDEVLIGFGQEAAVPFRSKAGPKEPEWLKDLLRTI